MMNGSGIESHAEGEDRLPSELAAAIERARQRTASKSRVQTLTANVLELTSESRLQVNPKATRAIANGRLYWLCVLAASIGLILSGRSWLTSPDERENLSVIELMTQPVYSTINTVSLTQVGYRQVEEDLDRADAQIEEVSEGLAIASVRHEIQKTLEEFYDWSK